MKSVQVTPLSSLRDQILATTATLPSRTRDAGRRRAAFAYGLAIADGILFFQAWGGLAHSNGRPRSLTLFLAVGATVLAVAASVVGLWRGRSMVGRPAPAPGALTLLVPSVTLGWLFAFHNLYAEPFARVGYRCLMMAFGSGALLSVAGVYLRRRTALLHAPLTGAATGASSGAWSAILVDLWCPLTNVPHALVSHVLPIVALTGLGAILGATSLAVRSRSRTLR